MKRENEKVQKQNLGGPAGSSTSPEAPDKPDKNPAPKEGSIQKVQDNPKKDSKKKPE